MQILSEILGLFTGSSRSGLCPTRNRPVGIGWQKIAPVANCQSNRVGQIKPSMGGGRVGWSHRFEKTARKRWEKLKSNENLIGFLWDFARSDENLTRFDEISLDPNKISSDLSGNFCWNLGFLLEYGKFGRNLEIIVEICISFDRFRFFRF